MNHKNFAVIGHSIGHTMSPFIHSRLFALDGETSQYGVLDLSSEQLFSELPQLHKLAGFNVTIPHKQAVIPFLDCIDEKAQFFHSVNTVKNENGKLVGYTTDGTGFTKALESAGLSLAGKTLILGAGGVARVMAFEAIASCENPDITFAVREHSLPTAKALCETLTQVLHAQGRSGFHLSYGTFEETPAQEYALLANGTPVGMYPNMDASPVTERLLNHCAAVFDAVYNPDETMLLKLAKKNGAKTLSGMGMLVWQAAAAHEIWNGASYKPTEIAALCEEAVAQMNLLFST